MTNLIRRAAAEAIGTAGLLAAIVGSGVMAERLSHGDPYLSLLANSIATGAALVALIFSLQGISGAHFNPAVSLAAALRKNLAWREFPVYVSAQVVGAFVGVAVAHLMFGLSMFSASTKARAGGAQVFSEFVATLGLLLVIEGSSRSRFRAVPFAVAAYITAAYWFTSSTSFANPAVTLARSLSNTFVGIRPSDTPAFILAQVAAAIVGTLLIIWLLPHQKPDSEQETRNV
jgi:glycerol uptake facilitator-like aquaporin